MISTRFNVDRWHAQTRGPKSNQRPGKQTEMANARINDQGQWPSKAATEQLQLDNAGGNCLPLVNNSTYHRRILDWKTQRRTHPAPQARINKNTFEWRCPLSVLSVLFLALFSNLLRRCSCLSVEGGARPLGPQFRQHFSSESLARTSSPNFQLGRVVFALNSAFDFGSESQHLAVCQPSLYSNCKTVKKQNKLTQTKNSPRQIQRKVKKRHQFSLSIYVQVCSICSWVYFSVVPCPSVWSILSSVALLVNILLEQTAFSASLW